MTVVNINNTIRETGNAVKVAFTFGFKIFAQGDLEVFKIDTSVTPEVSTLQVLNTDYTVAINVSTEGGTVTYTTAPIATEDSFIGRDLALTQPTDIPREANFPEESIENEFDRSRMIDIQQQTAVDLKIGFVSTSPTTGVIYPEPSADDVIGWNAAGDDLVNIDPTTLGLGGVTIGAGDALKGLRVNAGETAFELITPTHTLISSTDSSTDVTSAELESLTDGSTVTLHTHDHDVLVGFVANEHIDHSDITLTAGVGLSGGGDLT